MKRLKILRKGSLVVGDSGFGSHFREPRPGAVATRVSKVFGLQPPGKKKPRRSGVQVRMVRGGPDGLPRSESVWFARIRGRNPFWRPVLIGHGENLGRGCEKSVKKPRKRLEFSQTTVLFRIIRLLPARSGGGRWPATAVDD